MKLLLPGLCVALSTRFAHAFLDDPLGKRLEIRQSIYNESSKYVLPVGSPNFYHGQSTAAVTFDQHSVLLDGKRIMVFSGEFHPFRLPAVELWRDVLEKFKAGGFNGVSVYWHWGLTAPKDGVLRFTEHNDLAKFYTVAKEVGILVIVRPGPYVNAETAGGGFPGWTTNLAGLARTNATEFRKAWHPYIVEFAKQTAPFQYPNGPVIAVQSENEFATTARARIPGLDEHMQDIINTLRENGITKVPTIHNDKGPDGEYSQKGLGKVDLYGWDGYPLGFNCDQPSRWNELTTTMNADHQKWNPAELLALFEWQGGAFSYWSGPGYDQCYKLVNEQFANVYYKNSYASGVAIQNLYMTYGGTNWGNMHTHTIYSSYDYGAAIAEDRTLTPKHSELKLQGLFLHASPDYLLAGRVSAGAQSSDSTDIYTTVNRAPSGTHFYVVRQKTNTEITDTTFKLKVNTTLEGPITIPKSGDLVLAGRESKIIVTNYPFGASSRVQYSTAEILTWSIFDKEDTLVVYALAGQSIEVAIEAKGSPKVTISGSKAITAKVSQTAVTISGSPSGYSIVKFGQVRVIVVDKHTAYGLWAPRLSNGYDINADIPGVLVQGPYLVRSAWMKDTTLHLTGDINGTTTIDVFGSSSITSVRWNGAKIEISKTDIGTRRGTIAFPKELETVQIPSLSEVEWKCADSLPELAADYDDSTWVLANKTTTNRPAKFKPAAGKLVLYSSEYGFHAGQWVWRGHFDGAAKATGVELSIQGGFSFGYTAFLNGNYLGSGEGSSKSQQGVDILSPKFTFNPSHLVEGDNIITIVHDATGMNQDYNIDDEHKTPRGIRAYKLISASNADFTEWRVAGNVGGEDAPDAVRGPYNEGGWWFERVGAHLPGYDASSWATCKPTEGTTKPGVTVYRANFDVDFPIGSDIPLAFDFTLDKAAPHRVLLYVNGWQFGRFLSSLGPQTNFPIPEGILNHHGSNEVLISLWALKEGGAKLTDLKLTRRAVVSSSKVAKTDIVDAPGWKELRGKTN